MVIVPPPRPVDRPHRLPRVQVGVPPIPQVVARQRQRAIQRVHQHHTVQVRLPQAATAHLAARQHLPAVVLEAGALRRVPAQAFSWGSSSALGSHRLAPSRRTKVKLAPWLSLATLGPSTFMTATSTMQVVR